MQPLYLRLLGTPEVKVGTARFSFSAERRYQLLAYLAYAGEWVSRDKLAYLFWPDHSDEAARSNVRKALFKARKLSWLENLEQNADALRWVVETDVKDFQTALRGEKFEVVRELYHGPFLEGMELKAESEFATWLELERQRLHGLFRTAVFNQAEKLAKQGESNQAIRTLQRFLAYDALDEEAVQKLLLLLGEIEEMTEGVKVYQEFARNLERELGLEPSAETRELFERLEQPQLKLTTPHVTISPSFIGRTLELQELRDLLTQSDCRLLTILGAGGVGKTRVALQITKHLAKEFEDGVYVILLEALTAPELIVPKIIESFGLTLQGVKEPLEYLKNYLAKKHLLLVLDNFEHLVSGAHILSELLTACPQLKLLVTSRERLKLAEEWLLPLEGLNYPRNTNVTLEDALTFDAIQLFLGRARRLQPHFTLTQAEIHQLVDICHLVGGFPLGLELAASWVRYLSLAEIAKEIKNNTDFLHSQNRDVPARQQSIRATFEYSWKLLKVKERESLRQLSIFVGGFSRDAAEFVAHTSLSLLTSLVDKSLLRVSSLKRYSQHPLLYQFTREKLAEVSHEQTLVQQKHEDYFFRLLEDQAKYYKSDKQKQALDLLGEEFENINVAWHRALIEKRFAQIERVAIPLAYYYQIRGPWQEGLEVFRQARGTFKDVAVSLRSRAAEGEVVSGQAMLHCCVGNFAEAITTAHEGLALLRQIGKVERTVICLNILGITYFDTGDYDSSRENFEEALELAQKYGDKARVTALLGNLGVVEIEAGQLLKAEQRYQELTELYRRDKNDDGLVAVLSDFGDLLRMLGRFDEAKSVLEEGLTKAEALGIAYVAPSLLLSLGQLHLELKHHDKAQDFLSRALARAREIGSRRLQAESLSELGTLAALSGNAALAHERFVEALAISHDIKTIPDLLAVLRRFAQLQVSQGNLDVALRWLRLILAHPVTRRIDKEKARLSLEHLKSLLAPDNVNRTLEKLVIEVQEHGKAMHLEEVVEELLSRQWRPT